jgi:hypothetical protein
VSRSRRKRSDWDDAKAVTAGFLGGLTIGLLVWSTQIRRCRRDLFSRSPVRRLAALGYIGGRPSVDSARLLTEYVSWERRPALRRRAERLLRRMQTVLT